MTHHPQTLLRQDLVNNHRRSVSADELPHG